MKREQVEKNAASKKEASIPEVGLFWIDDSGGMFAKAVDYGEFRIFEGSHYELWNQAVRTNPKWRNLEYEEVPRGRVVCRKGPKKPEFTVYMPMRIWKHRNKVIRRFHLPAGHVRFDTADEHYQIP